MAKLSPEQRKALTEKNKKLKSLELELIEAKKREGIDEYVSIKVTKRNTRFIRTKIDGAPDKAVGHFNTTIGITAKKSPVLVPLSIATGKAVTGFMYYIEGEREGSVVSASVTARGDGSTQVAVGTLTFLKIPAGKTAEFNTTIAVRGKVGKQYHVVISRINYKLALSDARYQQYLKPIMSKSLDFS